MKHTINASKIHVLDRLSGTIPLVEFNLVNVTKPNLVRVLVDSVVAKEMLEKNIKNRRQRRAAVEYLKHQINTGEWRDDHPQPVIFSDKGRLIDGQHRLQAIAESEICIDQPLIIRVETGARDDVREYLDTGVPRTLDDRVELVPDPTHNKIISQLCSFGLLIKSKSYKRPSPDDAKEFFEAHMESSLFVAQNHKRDKGLGKINVGYAAMEYYELSPEKASLFYPALFVVDSDIQQARMLRDWLLRVSIATSARATTLGGGAARFDEYQRAVACMKAHYENRKIIQVRRARW